MDYDKLIEDLKTYKIREEKPLVCEKAVFAIKTFRAENNKLRADLARVTAERNAAQALLGEISGVIGSAPITTAFGIPLERIRELVEADREGRCVVIRPNSVTDDNYKIICRKINAEDIHLRKMRNAYEKHK